MRNTMTTISKVALALAGVVGLALAAETAQAQLVLNGTGSSSGRQFAGNRPVLLCDANPTPLLFVSSEAIPERYEWQCTVNGVPNSRVRYSATQSADAFVKQQSQTVGTAVFLNPAGCPAGVPTPILGRTVIRSVCPAATPTQILTVHWGGSDVQSSSLHQIALGQIQTPPPFAHLTTTPTVVVPFSIMVGKDVQNGSGGKLTSLTQLEIREIFAGTAINWDDLGYQVTGGPGPIFLCGRTPGSGALAALDEIIMLPGYLGTAIFTGNNARTTNMINCLKNNTNSIGYLDSDSVIPAIFPLNTSAYQVQIDGQPVNTPGGGLAGLTALRCGRYPYWTYWNLVTRTVGVEAAPVSARAGTNQAIQDLENAMTVPSFHTIIQQPNYNPLPDFWLSPDDMFVFKNQDRGPHHWVSTSGGGDLIVNFCD